MASCATEVIVRARPAERDARLMFGMPISFSPWPGRMVAALAALAFSGCSVLKHGGDMPSMPPAHQAGHGRPIDPNATARVIIDGATGDWGTTAHYVTRDRGQAQIITAPSMADVTTVTERSDGRYIYLRLDLARSVSLYGLAGTVSIDVDADDDAATGADGDGLAGTDFAIDLSPMVNGRITQGAAVRIMRGGAVVRTTDTYGLDFVLLPTFASSHAEMRIARGRTIDPAIAPVLSGHAYRAQIAVHDSSGAVAYRMPVMTAMLPPLDTIPRVPTTDPLARSAGTQFRALQWNVANEGLRDRPEAFRHIIAAIDPDLLVLDEVGGVIGREGVATFLASLDSGRSRPAWKFTYGGGGGYQRTVIAARTSVTEYPEFKLIPFPDSVTSRLLVAMPAAARAKQKANIDSGVATGGALVSLNGKRVAVFGVDLQSAGNQLGAWQEQRRVAEARIIRDHALAAIRAHGAVDAIIATGDHNLVGTGEPLEVMSEIGAAYDGASLVVANPLQLDSATAATWEGAGGGPFPPGRLDWFSYTGAALDVVHSFVFDTGDLGAKWQTFHHLAPDDSKKSSDHRPVVVDVRWRTKP